MQLNTIDPTNLPKRKRISDPQGSSNEILEVSNIQEDTSSDEEETLQHENSSSGYKMEGEGPDDINNSLSMIRDAALEEQKTRGRKKKSFMHISDPKKVTVEQRIREFQGEPFSIQAGNLYCDCCCSMLPRKFSSIKNHIKSKSHLKKRELAGFVEHSVIYNQILLTERHRQSGHLLPGHSLGGIGYLGSVDGDINMGLGKGASSRSLTSQSSLVSFDVENDYTKDLAHMSFEQLMERASLLVNRNEEISEQLRTCTGPARAFQYTLTSFVLPSEGSTDLPEASFRLGFREQLVEMDSEQLRLSWRPRRTLPKFLHVSEHLNDSLSFEFHSFDGLAGLSNEVVRALQKAAQIEGRPLVEVRKLIWALHVIQRHLLDFLSHFTALLSMSGGEEDLVGGGPVSRLQELEDCFLAVNVTLNQLLAIHGVGLDSVSGTHIHTPSSTPQSSSVPMSSSSLLSPLSSLPVSIPQSGPSPHNHSSQLGL